MDVVRGMIVRSSAGHDKGDFFVVIGTSGDCALICDGKHRPLDKPKKKKFKHLFVTKTVLQQESFETNRKVRKVLRAFIEKDLV